MFYLDVSVPPDQGLFETAMENLKKRTEEFYFLGSYHAAP
jgi:prephenate dehydratase